jgi:hypothetical protein
MYQKVFQHMSYTRDINVGIYSFYIRTNKIQPKAEIILIKSKKLWHRNWKEGSVR